MIPEFRWTTEPAKLYGSESELHPIVFGSLNHVFAKIVGRLEPLDCGCYQPATAQCRNKNTHLHVSSPCSRRKTHAFALPRESARLRSGCCEKLRQASETHPALRGW